MRFFNCPYCKRYVSDKPKDVTKHITEYHPDKLPIAEEELPQANSVDDEMCQEEKK